MDDLIFFYSKSMSLSVEALGGVISEKREWNVLLGVG